ncbi:hypothetical protein K2173_009727 [Erythroxylum novogranatense]|uniref:Photosystem II cytochrome b559 alpha subunit lumenal region domain-containing protein n=1 Tax=Erythroxylum novogranatense TaxID=1862640 RepID=A0AAV8U4R4_9ROSI|nr:hypothetical protein K2173_009727 [Erythroxylum novogranatense]
MAVIMVILRYYQYLGTKCNARHTIEVGHARSRYLNRKKGDAEGRASNWSEVVTSTGLAYDVFGSPHPNEYFTESRQGIPDNVASSVLPRLLTQS